MNIIISNSSEQPIYEQITLQMKNLILNGVLEEAELLPSIRNLAKELNISVITTKRSYEELEKEGFITTVPGKGSYVAVQNKKLLLESRLKLIEDKISEAVNYAKAVNLSYDELKEILKYFYETNN